MADPNPDTVDHAVDELKRKARRRLVGAVILALAAATLLPMLLEQEHKPLGDDVAIQIPPVDAGKFVNRLKGEPAKAPAADARPEPPPTKISSAPDLPPPPPAAPADALPAAPAVAKAEPADHAKTAAPPAANPAKAAPVVEAKPAAAPAASPPVSAPVSPPVAAPVLAPEPAVAPAASTPAPLPPPAAAPKGDGFVVQLGAFTDNYGANALASKLKKAGYPAYTEAVETGSRGTLYRVRVGSYPSREAAVDARKKLKADGHDGIVAAAK